MANSWNSPDQMAETLIKNLLGVADFVIDSKKLTDSDEIDLRLAVEALNKYRAPPLTATKSTLPPVAMLRFPFPFARSSALRTSECIS